MKIYLAQIDTTVGDLDGNCAKILERLRDSEARGADLVVFPELAVTGYPPRDLLESRAFIDGNLATIQRIAGATRGRTAALVGYVARNEQGSGNGLRNAAALCAGGRIVRTVAKTLLPTYDVFDEARHFEPSREAGIVDLAGERLGVSICEDAWTDPELFGRRLYDVDPIAAVAAGGAGLLVNLSASPFSLGRPATRVRLLAAHAARHGLPLVYVNLVGGNDELLFDGRSLVIGGDGRTVLTLAAFREDAALVEIEPGGGEPRILSGGAAPGRDAGAQVMDGRGAREPASGHGAEPGTGTGPGREPGLEPGPGTGRGPGTGPGVERGAGFPPRIGTVSAPGPADGDEALQALVMGLADYARKCGFDHAVVGLSGGIDSSVVAAIAAAALGPAGVTGVSMPSRYSSKGSVDDAAALAKNLGIELRTFPIEPMFAAYLMSLASVLDGRPPGIVEENLQARIRGNLLMALSNRYGWLVLATGNKSEMAVGYTTLYGDMSGGLAVISDVPKTLVYAIARAINRARPVIPESVLTKPPSAELRPDQKDQDTLPPYEILDDILRLHVEEGRSLAEIVGAGHDEAVARDIVTRIARSEYKRKQAPPGLRLTTKAFGLGRRMPIAQRYEERSRS